jgi:S-DNA-T family DNA segregation ATPase FtsK/SpoIIIE
VKAKRSRARAPRAKDTDAPTKGDDTDADDAVEEAASTAAKAPAPSVKGEGPAAPRSKRAKKAEPTEESPLDLPDDLDHGPKFVIDTSSELFTGPAHDDDAQDDDAGAVTSDEANEGDDESDAPESEPEAALAAPEKKPTARGTSTNAESITIVDTSAALAKEKPTKLEKLDRLVPALGAGFRLPPTDMLEAATVDPSLVLDEALLHKNAETLVKTLADYKVSGKVEEILPGPVVTTFEVSPVAGTKVSRVASLADDLALALAKKVRIVAPIPGKNRIGFELPNEKRLPVNLRDLVEDRRFQTLDSPLPVVLGRDIVGTPVYADLASMPHVIVAGATGAGKSVGLNVMLTSLLYRRTPEEMRLLLIDPKVVELAPFDRIPHMLLPVVTDMKQAATALKWAVDEMERRYQLFADAGTKNIGTYNAWVKRVERGEARNPLPKQVIAKDFNGFADAVAPEEGEEGTQPLPEKLPHLVIVVDEFADLMMQQGKEVEASIARLAQKARAAGMHVILATQRPSVDVITGMIKANFPTRIAFRVAQKIDSRTILDEQGAEHLLGKGDMLVKLNGTNDTRRVQCPFLSEEEVQKIMDFLRLQGEPVYDENILKPRDEEAAAEAEEDAEQDPMYDQAVRLVADTKRCSTSWLQRKLGLGYNRAARIVEMMEKRGLVGPANGSKDREVLFDAI